MKKNLRKAFLIKTKKRRNFFTFMFPLQHIRHEKQTISACDLSAFSVL